MTEPAEQLPDLPTPKFRMGQTVWHAGTTTTTEKHDCPDCLGQRKWVFKSPAGYEGEIECPRCNGRGHLGLHSAGPSVARLTIGMVRASTRAPYSGDDQVEYMCSETGIGSGSVYSESKLFETEDAARTEAEQMAALQRAKLDENNKDRAKVRNLYSLQYHDAEIKAADDRAWGAENRLRRLLDRICELDECPSGGGRYADNSYYASLEPSQIRAVQESLVWLDDKAADYLDEWRAQENAA